MKDNQQYKNSYNVCLMGCSLDTGNRGVSALTAALAKLIIKEKKNAKINLLIGNRSDKPQTVRVNDKLFQLNVINYRLSPKAELTKNLIWILFISILYRIIPINLIRLKLKHTNIWLNTLINADFVGDIIYGDSFSDIYGLNRFLIRITPIIIAQNLKCSTILLPQTYGPYKSLIAKIISKKILKNASTIISRDYRSQNLIKKMIKIKSEKQLIFCPDVAFCLDSFCPERKIESELEEFLSSNEDTIIGINISGLLYHGGYTQNNMFNLKFKYKDFIYNLLKHLLKYDRHKILLIPHTFGKRGTEENDIDASFKSVDRLKKENINTENIYILRNNYDQYEVKFLIGKCNFFIGSRMHACIAALSQGIPTIGIAYSKKFEGIFNSVGFEDCVIDARTIDIGSAIEYISLKMKDIKEIEFSLKKNVEEAIEKTQKVFSRILNELYEKN